MALSNSHFKGIAACPMTVVAVDEYTVLPADQIEWRTCQDLSVGPPGHLEQVELIIVVDSWQLRALVMSKVLTIDRNLSTRKSDVRIDVVD